MMSFKAHRLAREPVAVSVVNLIAAIEEFKGKQHLFSRQSPQLLEALRQVAMVQSTESSNRIEGITVPAKKLRELVEARVAPKNRSESEVVGYRDVLATIHASAPHMPVTPNVILQLHRDLYHYVPSEGGRWKPVDNTIDDVLPDGSHRIRFKPVSWMATPGAMEELCTLQKYHAERSDVPALLRISAFVLDFLCVHPFIDGNGRMARLMTLLLLYQADYEVGRYISLEKIVEKSKETYYEALKASSRGWHEGKHTLVPWSEYFLGVLLSAYREFEKRAGTVAMGRGAKTALVRQMVERTLIDFGIGEILSLCPGVSRPMVRTVLEQMRSEGKVVCLGKGAHARWRRHA